MSSSSDQRRCGYANVELSRIRRDRHVLFVHDRLMLVSPIWSDLRAAEELQITKDRFASVLPRLLTIDKPSIEY